MVITVKHCSRCKQDLDINLFGLNKSRSDGRYPYCSTCRKEYDRQYKAKNSEKLYLQQKNWRENNRERKALMDKRWAENNKDKANANKKRWKERHPDKVKAGNKAYLEKNKELLREKNAEWRKKYPEKNALKEARRRVRKANNGIFEVSAKEVKKMLDKPCFYCGSISEHLDHIIPISRGGRHSIGNLVQSCQSCNCSKNNKFIVEWKNFKNDRR